MQSKCASKLYILVLFVMCGLALGQGLNQLCTTSKHRIGRCIRLEDCSVVTQKSKSDSMWNETMCISNGRQNREMLVCCPILENCNGCGEHEHKIMNRIVGGSEADAGSYPWAALLMYNLGRGVTRSLCGGVLINSQHVLTAAHCIEGLPRNWRMTSVRLGNWDADDIQRCNETKNDTVCQQEYDVQRVILHDQYNRLSNGHQNDIALLQLAKNVTISEFIRPICLPLDEPLQIMPVENEEFTVVGWGETETGFNSLKLREVIVTGRHIDKCNEVFRNQKIKLTSTQLCIGGEDGKDSCRGDSGGPLMRRLENTWYLVGMVSFGDRTCGAREQPSVYTNIVPFIDWIEHQMIELS